MRAPARRLLGMATVAGVVAGLWAVQGRATGLPQSFMYLQDGFTQSLIGRTTDLLTGDLDDDGVPDAILGGVAFANDGDPIVAECEFQNTRIHRYDLQAPPVSDHDTDLAPETMIPSHGGCAMVNHPNGNVYVAMNDGINGVAVVDRETGALVSFQGPPSNALGIAVDPQTNDLVYAAADCRFTGTCTFVRMNPDDGASTVFAQFDGSEIEFVDGMYFAPGGNYLFMATRSPMFALTVLNRDGMVVQHIPMDSEPDGVAFHATSPKFVVTNNTDGTMTRFDFPDDDYSQAPMVSLFAAGGFRGDLSQVGPDGCIYLTQKGTRYNDGIETEWDSPENSVVRICTGEPGNPEGGGFVPPPGTESGGEEPPPLPIPANVGGTVYHDVDKDGVRDSGEPGIPNVVVTLDGLQMETAMTAADGTYLFMGIGAGDYTVSSPDNAAGKARFTSSPIAVTLVEGETRDNVDFGYVNGGISGYAYIDANRNSLFDSGESGLGGVPVTLVNGATVTTNSDGSYAYAGLDAGNYQVGAAATAFAYNLATNSPLSVSLAFGETKTDVNFGYANGSISGFAYVDANGNGQMDSGEAGIGGVSITLAGGSSATATTNPNGSYFFNDLLSSSYSVSAPSTAGGRTRTTPSPLSVSLSLGQNVTNVNFGYQSPAPYRTQTQGGWGSTPNGNNPGMLLQNNFAAVFPSGVTIGGTKTLTFTSAAAIRNFLPAGGKAAVLTASATNPTKSSAGVFAGQVLALKLSVSFSNAGVTTNGLSALKIAPGRPLAGSTVAQILTMANAVLGGNTGALPSGFSLSNLNDVVASINENFVDGTVNNGFLVP